VRARPAAGGTLTARARAAVADLVPPLHGTPAGGGSLPPAVPSRPLVTVAIDAAGVATRDVATALNLPFRSDAGRVTARLTAAFRQPASAPPELHGDAAVSGVALRFHPDGDVPALSGFTGRLRFDDAAVFFDGPTGALGSLPLTVVGCLDVERGYDLVGVVRPVGVDALLDTFAVRQCVPIVATVRGQARMSGPLYAPVVAGWTETVAPGGGGGGGGSGGSGGGGSGSGSGGGGSGHVGAAADTAGGAAAAATPPLATRAAGTAPWATAGGGPAATRPNHSARSGPCRGPPWRRGRRRRRRGQRPRGRRGG